MIPFVRKDSYLPNKKLVPLVIGNGYTTVWDANGLAQYFKETGKIVSFNTTKSSPILSLLCSISPVQSGSGDPAPDNVRPITGQTGVTAYVAGENLFDAEDKSGTLSGVDYSAENGNEIVLSGATESSVASVVFRMDTTISLKNGDVFTLVFAGKDIRSGDLTIYLRDTSSYFANKNVANTAHSVSFTMPSDKEITNIQFRVLANSTIDFDCNVIAYIGTATTIPVTFPADPGTVYGGTVDLVSGVLTVDMAFIELDGSNDESWSAYNASHSMLLSGVLAGRKNQGVNANIYGRCNLVKSIDGIIDYQWLRATGTISANLQCYGIDTTWGVAWSMDAWRAFLSSNPLQIVYELAEPLVYQLTPQAISTIAGQNNVWQESADYVTVETNIYE